MATTASIAPSGSLYQAIAIAAARLVLLATLTVSDAWPTVPVPALPVALLNILPAIILAPRAPPDANSASVFLCASHATVDIC